MADEGKSGEGVGYAADLARRELDDERAAEVAAEKVRLANAMGDGGKGVAVPALFEGMTVAEFPVWTAVERVASTDTLGTALKLLVEKGLQAAPIVDEVHNRYLGYVDVMDLVVLIADLHRRLGLVGTANVAVVRTLELLLSNSSKSTVALLDETSRTIRSITMGATMAEVVALLTEGHGEHRVPVIDSRGNITKIISQSAVVQVLYQNLDKLGDVMGLKVRASRLGFKHVHSVDVSDAAIEAFALMAKHRISAVAVTDKTLGGAVVSTVSATDVRMIANLDKLHLVCSTVGKFVAAAHAARGSQMVTVPLYTTLRGVVEALAKCKVHRVYVVEERYVDVHADGSVAVKEPVVDYGPGYSAPDATKMAAHGASTAAETSEVRYQYLVGVISLKDMLKYLTYVDMSDVLGMLDSAT